MNKKHINGWLKHADFIIIDVLVMQLSFIIAYWLHVEFKNPYNSENYAFQAVVLLVSQLVVIAFTGSYAAILRRRWFDEIVAVVRYLAEIIVTALLFMFMIHLSSVASRLQIGFTSVTFIILDFVFRTLNKIVIFRTRSSRADRKSVVLITSERLIPEAMTKLTSDTVFSDFTVTGIVIMDPMTQKSDELQDAVSSITDWDEIAHSFEREYEIPVLPLSDEAVEEIGHGWVDEIFILQPDDMSFPGNLVSDLMEMGITVNYSLSAINDDRWPGMDVRKLGSYKVITNSIHFATVGDLAIKRGMDVVGGIIGCIITGIIFIFVAPIIYIKSPGPIFFSQERVGRNGRTFRMYKFRSMYMDAEERKAALMSQNKIGDGMMFKMDDDPRIIGSEKKDKKGRPAGIGNFIRKTSLDEFPQFFNVLKGEMSMVGTRPPTLDEWQKYKMNHRVRMSIRPGLTGMWQVSGRSAITDFNEVVKLDREYIENWSISLDVKIILKTIAVVFMRSGAS